MFNLTWLQDYLLTSGDRGEMDELAAARKQSAALRDNYIETVSQQKRATEMDPNGLCANTPGAKLDAGKTRVSLVLGGFARALHEVARVGTYGANKYTDNGWVMVPNGLERYTDAMCRHQLKEWQGEVNDPDTDLAHAAHLAWNALARLELMLRKNATS